MWSLYVFIDWKNYENKHILLCCIFYERSFFSLDGVICLIVLILQQFRKFWFLFNWTSSIFSPMSSFARFLDLRNFKSTVHEQHSLPVKLTSISRAHLTSIYCIWFISLLRNATLIHCLHNLFGNLNQHSVSRKSLFCKVEIFFFDKTVL